LISTHNVNFIEDSLSNDLVIIDNILLSPESINKLVDNAILINSIPSSILAPNPSKVALLESHLFTPSPQPIKKVLLPPLVPKKASK